MKNLSKSRHNLYHSFLDVCEAAITVIIGVSLVLAMVWTLEAYAVDVELTWDQDESVTVDNFNAQVRTSSEPAVWNDLVGEPTPTGGGGPYSMTLFSVSPGVYRYRVNAENVNGISDWTYSTWATIGAGEPPGTPPATPVLTIIIQQ